MAYIGKSPAVGNFIKLDAITTSATATYNLVNGGVAYSPESVNHMLVSLNGVIQSPTTAFTVAGTTIVFASTLSSSDVIDFIMVYGDVLNLGVPSDATVTDAKITAMAASKLTGALPAISGASLTALNATNLGSGTVPTARLGTGSASSSVFLSGANTWIAAGGGKIGQVLQSSVITVNQTLTSTSFIDVTSVTIDITPSATSSKVLILAHIGYQGPSSSRYWNPTILRATTNLGDSSEGFGRYYSDSTGIVGTVDLHYLDSPSTTSATTYKVQALVQDASYSTVLNNFNQSYITVMEVLA